MMSPHLIIRLPEHADQPVHWQRWPEPVSPAGDTQQHGVCETVAQLSTLKVHFNDEPVIVLVPAAQTTVHQLTVTGKITPAVLQSLPWRLEDELSEDVDALHFTVLHQQKQAHDESDAEDTTRITLSVVANSQMALWQSWLEAADISSKQWLPDALALPSHEGNCSVLAINDDVLIKQGAFDYGHCDRSWLDLYLNTLKEAMPEQKIEALTPIDSPVVSQPINSPNSPISPMASGAIAQTVNLLHGKWQLASPWVQRMKPWRSVAILLIATLLLAGGQSLSRTYQLEQQAAALDEDAKSIYRKLFPTERIQVVSVQMRQKLAALQGSGDSSNGLLDTLAALQPVFKAFPQLKPINLQYQSRQNTLRVEAQAKDFETFTRFRDQFSEQLQNTYTISVDAVERSDKDTVTGLLVISGKTV